MAVYEQDSGYSSKLAEVPFRPETSPDTAAAPMTPIRNHVRSSPAAYHGDFTSPQSSNSSDSQYLPSDGEYASPAAMHRYDSRPAETLPGDHSDHVVWAIKLEGHPADRPCANQSNPCGFGNSMTPRDPWAFRDGIGLHGNQLKQMNMQNSTGIGHMGVNDCPPMGRPQGTSSFYSPPLPHASAYGHPAPYGWESAGNQPGRAYHYGVSETGGPYRHGDSAMTGYPYSHPISQNSSPGCGSKDMHLTSNPSIQDMDAERTIRRARRNRTCFSKHQLEKLEDVFKESKYPDVYRREEIAAQLDLKEEVVRVWFKNRRAKLKRESKDVDESTSHISTPSPGVSSGLVNSKTAPSFPMALYPSPYPIRNSCSPITSKLNEPTSPSSKGHTLFAKIVTVPCKVTT